MNWGFTTRPLAGLGAGADGSGWIPVISVAGGEGENGEELEETELYPFVGSDRAGGGRRGVAHSRPRRRRSGEGKRRWGGRGASPSHGEAS